MRDHTPTSRLVLLALAAIVSMPLVGCTKNAATGRSQINALSRSEEIEIGEAAMPELIQQYGGEVPDPYLQQYIRDIGHEMAQHTEADFPSMPWEFTFLNSPVINAFALPGGKVFITRGLVEEMDNEAQLAGVLGHEIGHVTAQHADDRISRQMVLAGIAIGASIAVGTQSDNDYIRYGLPALVTGAGVFALTYDRNEELESDALGMRYMAKAGYDPIGQRQVMEILGKAAGGSSPPEFLSTHPLSSTRIKKIDKRLKGGLKYTQDNPEYGLYAERFQQDFMPRLRALPPMPGATTGHLETPENAIGCSCWGCRGGEGVSVAARD